LIMKVVENLVRRQHRPMEFKRRCDVGTLTAVGCGILSLRKGSCGV
jgi:hypothetical protein